MPAETVKTAMVDELISRISGADRDEALVAWRALWALVRRTGRPGAEPERKSMVQQLIGLVAAGQSTEVRREALWMLSEIGQDESVGAVAALILDQELREDARMVLERIPGDLSCLALQRALAAASADFQPALAESLRRRGVDVAGFPCPKLVPTKTTQVKPLPT